MWCLWVPKAMSTGFPIPREHDHPWTVGAGSLEDKIATPWAPLTNTASILNATLLPDLAFLPSFSLWPNVLFVILFHLS